MLARAETQEVPSTDLIDVTVLDAVTWIDSAWNEMTPNCTRQCFKKAGFLPDVLESASPQ